MRFVSLSLAACLLLLFAPEFVCSQSGQQNNQVISGDMAEVLATFATKCHVPMLLELAEPVPKQIEASISNCDSTRFLSSVLTHHPDQSFEVKGRVLHVFDKNLQKEKNNFLNWKFDKFTLPENVAEFENILGAKLEAKREGVNTKGGVINGLYPDDLAKRTLPSNTYIHKTTREILLDVENIDGSFMTSVIFPKDKRLSSADVSRAFSRWQWTSILPERQ